MISQPLNPPSIAWTIAAPRFETAAVTAISTDIRAVQLWREREFELAAIRKLSTNWDGRGSDAPSLSATEAAALFLAIWKDKDYATPPARIALSPAGFVNVDWLDGEALVRAEVLDLESNEIEWMKAIPGQPTEFFSTVLLEQQGPGDKQEQTWRPAPDEHVLAFAR